MNRLKYSASRLWPNHDPLDTLSQQAFVRGRQGFLALRGSHNLQAFAEVPTLKFAAGVGINCRPKPGQSRDGVPVAQECSWSDFAEESSATPRRW